VIFEDGTREAIDIIIYATGYKVTFPFFKEGFFNVEDSNDLQLYRRVVHPDFKNLFFLGLIQPLGAIMPLAEVQSLYVAKVLNGEVALPGKEQMVKDIESQRNKLRKRYNQSPRHTLQVDFFPYKESILKEIKKMRTGKKIQRQQTQTA